jgi:hypothetical protein
MSSALRDFNAKYLKILEDYFGAHYERMKKKGQSIEQASTESMMGYTPQIARSVYESMNEEIARLDWDGVEHRIAQQGGVKALIEAPVESLLSTKSIQRLALYADTVIFAHRKRVSLDAPLMHPQVVLQGRILQALGLLQAKDLFLADVTPPIAAIVRPFSDARPEAVEGGNRLTEHDFLAIAPEIFDAKFSSYEEVLEFVRLHGTIERLFKDMKKPEALSASARFDGDKAGGHRQDHAYSLREHIESQMQSIYLVHPNRFAGLGDPELLVTAFEMAIRGNLAVANSQLLSCGRLAAQPSADNDRQWRYLVWKFNHDSKFFAEKFGLKDISKGSLVLNALQLDDFYWLGNVPIEAIVRLREDGELQDIRDTLSRGIERIETVSHEDFSNVTRQVRYNLEQEFKRHRKQLKEVQEKFQRKYDFDVSLVAVGGSIAVMSALFPPLALVAGAVGAAGGGVMKFISDVLEERSTRLELKRKPVALLLEAHENL